MLVRLARRQRIFFAVKWPAQPAMMLTSRLPACFAQGSSKMDAAPVDVTDSLASRVARQRLDRQKASTDTVACFEAFLAADEVDATEATFADLCEVASCQALQGSGPALYDALKAALMPKLNFRLGKIFSALDAKIKTNKALADSLGSASKSAPRKPSRVVVCGAGPVGLRAAVEAAIAGMEVVVVEKRTSFSRDHAGAQNPGDSPLCSQALPRLLACRILCLMPSAP